MKTGMETVLPTIDPLRPARYAKGISEYVVVYDISSAQERRHVDKILKGFGFRVQRSVFECVMNRRMKSELTAKLAREPITTGSLKIYRLEYSSKNETFGDRKTESIDTGYAFIV